MSVEIQRRLAVRGLMVDESDASVLLIHTHIPDSGKLIWLAPGGGRESGETEIECLLREIKEETGHVADKVFGPVWFRQKVFKLHNQTFDQHETFYWVPTSKFEPNAANNPALEERDIFRGFRWWTLDEIREAKNEIFVPLTFADHLADLFSNDLPNAPVDVGV